MQLNLVELLHLTSGLFLPFTTSFRLFPNRWNIITSKLKNVKGLTLKSLSGTRWSPNADAVHALRKHYDAVSASLLDISNNTNEKDAPRYEAICILSKMKLFEKCSRDSDLGHAATMNKQCQQEHTIKFVLSVGGSSSLRIV
ncbi:hypothetical protein JTE90_018177 [Oedothorax gibbosus]|uniref:Uncharacterized protein n=1 Tax=Oedothorax gibbosus TaxID=931172 RepID=A0AAV6U905_9ARAC|nr:hypothetical protein JTE90_018177 [Oedothorax gibbosus]